MFSVVGTDIGNISTISTSDDNQIVIESRIKEFTNLNELGSNEVFEYEGKKYVVEQGKFENNYIKHDKENFLQLLFYSIAKVAKEDRVKLVLGIPAGQYNQNRDKLKKFIMENNFKRITIGLSKDSITRNIFIDEVMICPESYGVKAIGAMKQCKANIKSLVIDIGGGTTDIAEFDEQGKFIDGESIETGLLDLYRNTRKVLNDEFGAKATLEEARKYFDGELELMNGDNEYKKPLLLDNMKSILNELRGLYPNMSQLNLILTGGGAKKGYSLFSKLYPQTIVVSDITANSRGFYNVGVKKWVK